MDTEDRQLWYRRSSEVLEPAFVDRLMDIGVQARINPEKKWNPTGFDLQVLGKTKWIVSELKVMFMPFFRAKRLYGIDPQYAFTFNVSDYLEYRKENQDTILFFWINWQTYEGYGEKVLPMDLVWWCYLGDLITFIEKNKPPVHAYARRKTDPRRNAKESFVFDVRSVGRLVMDR